MREARGHREIDVGHDALVQQQKICRHPAFLVAHVEHDLAGFWMNDALAGSPYRFGDYEVGERIDHVDGVTLEEAEHMMATRLCFSHWGT